MEILADLQGDLDFFREREGDMLGDLIFGGVQPGEGREIRLGWMFGRLDRDAFGGESFGEHCLGK